MKSKLIWALVALNVLLAISLVTPLVQPAEAQAIARPGDYLMIPGNIIGGNNAIIWVLDSSNQSLSAITLNQASNNVDMMPPLDLKRIFGR